MTQTILFVIFIGLVTGCVVCMLIDFYCGQKDEDLRDKIEKKFKHIRADSLPKLDQTEDVEVYMNFTCRTCKHFDEHDMCLCRKHYGTVIQNTVEYCKRDNNFKKNKI